MKRIVLGLVAAAALMFVGTPAMALGRAYRAGFYAGAGYRPYYSVYRPYYGPAYYPPAYYPPAYYPAPVYPVPVYPAPGVGVYTPGFSLSVGP
ncbi:MAG: hypothetical protein HY288_19580 [Planctomycetia bacterium]|nr:hypothetical protein [Planctomycetia bacterium]